MISTVGASSAFAQFREGGDPKGPKLGEAQVQRWQFGLVVQTPSGPARDMIGYVPLPSEWPEQQLAVVGEEVSPGVHTGYETVDGTVKVMIVKIAQLPAGSEAKALSDLRDPATCALAAGQDGHLRVARTEEAP